MRVPILLHIPHSSTKLPAEYRAAFCLSDAQLQTELLHMTDRYVDAFALPGLTRLRFPVSRLVCDVERFRSDGDESMASVGMGAVYTHGSLGQPIRRISPPQKEELLRRYYDAHHRRLAALAGEMLHRCSNCTVLDLHSFASVALPYEQNGTAPRPEICIGTDPFHTPEALYAHAEQFFRNRGYTVGRNTPFAGTIVPLPYYRTEAALHSMMLEIRRDLYMDEKTGGKTAGFTRVRNDVWAYQRELVHRGSAAENTVDQKAVFLIGSQTV